ncbi:AAA family ATPase [Chloroflexota bacterium]
MSDNVRYGIDHNGEIVEKDTELCSDLDGMIVQLFSQFGWEYEEIEKHGPYHKIKLSHPSGKEYSLNVYSGKIRNEHRNPFEVKIQLNGSDPRLNPRDKTIILGVYVFNNNDALSDAIIIGYPVDDSISYDSNPSLRGVFVNKILHQAKLKGFYADKSRNLVGFRPEFIFYYLDNFKQLHYDFPAPVEAEEPAEHEFVGTNRIIFGAPGTGKSYKVEAERAIFGNNYERVTFHPNYSYAQFVGTYKPTCYEDTEGAQAFTYHYVPGPFMRILEKALNDPETSFLIIIEEINRANVTAVFGDVFQLLDRKNGVSEYPINTSEDMKAHLLETTGASYEQIKIPKNMFIWATMNSADQGVYPVDTAFKRRWNFEYLGIDNNESLADKDVQLTAGHWVNWNKLRKEINEKLSGFRINEDKLIGPFFLGLEVLGDQEAFNEAFKSKLLMYLFEDAARQHRGELFSGCDSSTFSSIQKSYDEMGEQIFGFELAFEIGSTEDDSALDQPEG